VTVGKSARRQKCHALAGFIPHTIKPKPAPYLLFHFANLAGYFPGAAPIAALAIYGVRNKTLSDDYSRHCLK